MVLSYEPVLGAVNAEGPTRWSTGLNQSPASTPPGRLS
jgi:hypothetical protein